MTDSLQYLGDLIVKRSEQLANDVHEQALADVPAAIREQADVKAIEAKIILYRTELIAFLGQGICSDEDHLESLKKIEAWGKETAAYFYRLGVQLDKALLEVTIYRKRIWKEIERETIQQNMPASVVFQVISRFDPLLDHAVYSFSLTYVEEHQKTLEHAKTAFLELSVPVVPLLKGVGVLPLVGNMDTERSRLLMEKSLEQASELHLTHLIIDVSGVEIIDTMVADQLFKVMDALGLIGVETMITGIRPEVAQTMVSLGLNISGINVKASLQDAFEQLRLVKKQ